MCGCTGIDDHILAYSNPPAAAGSKALGQNGAIEIGAVISRIETIAGMHDQVVLYQKFRALEQHPLTTYASILTGQITPDDVQRHGIPDTGNFHSDRRCIIGRLRDMQAHQAIVGHRIVIARYLNTAAPVPEAGIVIQLPSTVYAGIVGRRDMAL
ncbi:hypothetical protein [Thiolapillus sp.]|nr:hypothetical protein [Thiolapillus sp.]